ncbi:Uroporphyrinogen III synthase HEM4 [Xanthobacter versatilis]|uniref:Uroporphyrinogen III synthase HEM4 n=1 Tax=Xanthobacter autotrophicus (strain ATCC BAA-1158 / Py2) TaxID=78245 RepID=A7IEG5_XANP2|nr:Uroporphyrinogen III synthase HEM4 [Xanthobacter autotrophicus Py2]
MHILVTRPEPAASQTAERLRTLGHAVTVDPMLRIAPTAPTLPEGPFDAVAFTSINGVKAFAQHPQGPDFFHLPAFAVGPRTSKEARAIGFANVTDCDGDASALAGRIAGALPAGARVLNPAGEDRAADLQALLAAPGISLELAIVYAAQPADALSEEAHAALASGTVTAALHLSQRTVKTLLACVAAAGLNDRLIEVRQLCLSEQVAEPLVKAGLKVEVATAPNEDALLALL